MPQPSQVNPRAVFVNNELNLHKIGAYGFDYDYTLAVYTRNLNGLIYGLAMNRLVNEMTYPTTLAHIPYDISFPIRGLHYDIDNCCLLKVDAFNQIQKGTVYRGRKKLDVDEVKALYGGFSLPDNKGKRLPQLIDLPWAGLLSTIVEYFDEKRIVFDPVSLYHDVAESVRRVHMSGELYAAVIADFEAYVHKNVGLKEYLDRLRENEKELFLVSNSPFSFINAGMTYMLGSDWRKYFKYVVVSARKPDFFQANTPFRLSAATSDSLSFEKVTVFEPNRIYAAGNITEFSERAQFRKPGVLYFGDHIYSDLADPMLRLGWHTAAIVPELAREIRVQNRDGYRHTIMWMEALTHLIECYQKYSRADPEAAALIEAWVEERRQNRQNAKGMFNEQFGSMFRTFHNMSYFYRRLSRLSDIYTSRLPNLLQYSDDHVFFPRRNALPHEAQLCVPSVALEITGETSEAQSASLTH
ncbi:5-nucleotidase domain containing 2-like protein [Aphelenchoides avenae]|nr:5-nucleotidase domain containing 2-like protein [Aphelenchus avenae]